MIDWQASAEPDGGEDRTGMALVFTPSLLAICHALSRLEREATGFADKFEAVGLGSPVPLRDALAQTHAAMLATADHVDWAAIEAHLFPGGAG